MELRDYIIIVLHKHGIIRMNKACLRLLDLLEGYFTSFDDMLLTGLLQETASRHKIELPVLYSSLRALALRMGRKDPEWFSAAFPEGYSAPVFIKAMVSEVQASLDTWDRGQNPPPGIG